MPSFDVVNRLDFQEIDNAIGNATREITNRYDFKGSDTSIERKDNDLTVITEDELKLKSLSDLLGISIQRISIIEKDIKKKFKNYYSIEKKKIEDIK